MDRHAAEAYIRAATFDCIAKAKKLYPAFIIMPTFDFKLRGRSRVGQADLRHNHMNFNMDYIMLNPEAYLATVYHEVAHLVAHWVYGEKGHGRRWRVVDLSLGGNGNRCNQKDVTGLDSADVAKARRTQQFLYRDTLGVDRWIGAVHHTRLQAGTVKLRRRTITGYRLTFKATGAKIGPEHYQHQSRVTK